MSLRLAVLAFAATIATAVAACQSSGSYGTPANAALGTGLAVAAAAANRAATKECWAQCRPGTVCNHQSGLCEPLEPHPTATPAVAADHKPPLSATASYPPGHEYDVPASTTADAGCDPTTSSNGSLSCEMDASAMPQ